MSSAESREIIQAVREEIDQAVDVILTAAESALKDVGATDDCDPALRGSLQANLSRIMEACAFHDITGQRLSKLGGMLNELSAPQQTEASLLNGPALAGQGIDQAAADILVQALRT